jgi:HAD superfamily hydrolase (TIGR01509 family)
LINQWLREFDWQQVDTVLLDMDGTLLDLHFDSYFWLQHLPLRYGEKHGISPDQAAPDIHRRLDNKRGTLDWYCTRYWSKELDLDIPNLKREIKHLIAERPQAFNFLENLKLLGKQRILVTNAHRDSINIKFEVTRLESLIDQVVSSHDYGCPKEDQHFWQQLQMQLQFDPQRTLFIDDSEAVLHSAHRYGIRHLLAIETPDSQDRPRPNYGYPAVTDFAQLLSSQHG